jgi:hypothetical protein
MNIRSIEITLTWVVLMGGISLEPATVGSGLGDCRAPRANLSNDLGRNLDNPLRDTFLEGRREDCDHHGIVRNNGVIIMAKVHTPSSVVLWPLSSAK